MSKKKKFGEIIVKCKCGNEIYYEDIEKKRIEIEYTLYGKMIYWIVGIGLTSGLISMGVYKSNDILFGFTLAVCIGFFLLALLSDVAYTIRKRKPFKNENSFQIIEIINKEGE